MNVELIIDKERIPYIVEALGADRVKISDYDKTSDRIVFEQKHSLDFLYVFHAGVRCGSETMAKALTSR
jgi:hypothetical protein